MTMRGWIGSLVVTVAMLVGAPGVASARGSVDWTPYLEKPGERVKPRRTSSAPIAKAKKAKKAKRAKLSKRDQRKAAKSKRAKSRAAARRR